MATLHAYVALWPNLCVAGLGRLAGAAHLLLLGVLDIWLALVDASWFDLGGLMARKLQQRQGREGCGEAGAADKSVWHTLCCTGGEGRGRERCAHARTYMHAHVHRRVCTQMHT